MLLGALVVAVVLWPAGAVRAIIAGVVVAVAGVGFVLWSYRAGRHVPLEHAFAATTDGGGYVLWKPGCAYCERLLAQLGGDERLEWVNVWRDPEANAVVRAHNGGDELTPTAVVGDLVLRNPTAEELRAALDTRGGARATAQP